MHYVNLFLFWATSPVAWIAFELGARFEEWRQARRGS